MFEPVIGRQNGPLEVAQGAARFEAEFFVKVLACHLVDMQCVGLAAGTVQRQHELPVKSFMPRILRDESVQVTDDRAVIPEFESSVYHHFRAL